MSFEVPQQNKMEIWLNLVDKALGKHKDKVEEILKNTKDPKVAVRMLSIYMDKDNNVTLTSERDSAIKLGTKMPDFISDEEETLWDLFIQLRSDIHT